MDAVRIFEERLLHALEQTALARLPPGWDLEPVPANLRAAARVVERVAGLPDRAAMASRLRGIGEESRKNRGDRSGEERLWEHLIRGIEGLSDRPDGAPDDLRYLALWQGWSPWEGVQSPLTRLRHDLDGLLPATLPASDAFLDRASGILLRALARRWVVEAKEREAGETKHPGPAEAARP